MNSVLKSSSGTSANTQLFSNKTNEKMRTQCSAKTRFLILNINKRMRNESTVAKLLSENRLISKSKDFFTGQGVIVFCLLKVLTSFYWSSENKLRKKFLWITDHETI